jgi:hypothetical protein
MQWVVVSVIVAACAVFSIRASVRWIQQSIRSASTGVSLPSSPCGHCRGCEQRAGHETVHVVTLRSRIPS